ncbi:MAG: FAD-binding domain-containing protein [Verrucomicrobiales bacterium]
MISEEEVVSRVLEVYPFAVAEKFLQEVCWRSYWKGWLEMRPSVWDQYLGELQDLRKTPEGERADAILKEGSGNAIIDHFMRELRETGYLHNHARMWFAGWWVHQAGLPWQLGAKFFIDHLLDADAASNTLSWRWVAGQQTPGKCYLTRASNLARYLDVTGIPRGEEALGLFQPREDPPIEAMESLPPDLRDIGKTSTELPDIEGPVLLWIHPEDLSVESWLPESFQVAGILAGNGMVPGDFRGGWLEGAVGDGAARAQRRWNCRIENVESAEVAEKLMASAQAHGTNDVVSAYIPTGPLGDQKKRIRAKLSNSGITWHEVHRSWDLRIWPLARAGFFPFWKKLSAELRKAK